MNFFVEPAGGLPGGEAGISKLGTGGIVRLRIWSRVLVYGDAGAASSSGSGRGVEVKSEGIGAGPGGGPGADGPADTVACLDVVAVSKVVAATGFEVSL